MVSNKNLKLNSIIISIFLLLILVFTIGCVNIQYSEWPIENHDKDGVTIFSPNDDIKVKQFKSTEELEKFIANSKNPQNNYYGGVMMRDEIMLDAVAMDVADSSKMVGKAVTDSNGGQDYSETNIQVQGIDEADIIKTDGKYIYTISDKVLFVVDAYPGKNSKVLSEIKFNYHPISIFINDDKLVVFGNIYDRKVLESYGFKDYSSKQIVEVYDISNKQKIELVNEIIVDGNYKEARMVDSNIYFITNSYSYENAPYPVIYRNGLVEKIAIDSMYYYPLPYDSIQYVNIFTFDLDDVKENDFETEEVTLVVDGFNDVYMSENNIYVTTMEYINEWKISQEITKEILYNDLSNDNKELIDKIQNVDSDILSDNEKESKIMGVYQKYIMSLSLDDQELLQNKIEELTQEKLDEYEAREYTIIHRIEVDGLDLSVESDAKIPGRMINQFAMDENDDILRVAVTISGQWNRILQERTKSENRIYTLDMGMNLIDVEKGIAKDESIFSVRFIEDRLYMVTFKQVDPFFVFEIDSNGKITELGKLKIPGFSRYLHPYDENTIIGIGKDTNKDGRTQGLKISLFDVSDVENPIEISKWVSNSKYSNSNALYEHKAFLFSKEKNLLVIPAYSYEWVYDVEGDYRSGRNIGYNGALVFNISKHNINLKGLVKHDVEQRWNAAVERSLYIEELLYTKSRGLLQINDIDSLENVNSIKLDY